MSRVKSCRTSSARAVFACLIVGSVFSSLGVPVCRGQNVTITGSYNATQNLDVLYSGSGDRTAQVSALGTVDVPAGLGNGVHADNFGFWTLTNAGIIRGDNGVSLGLGGLVTNQNEILARALNGSGVFLANGGGLNTVVNESAGTITAGISASVGGIGVNLVSSSAASVVDNSGRIYAYGNGTSSRGTAVVLNGGGTLVNRAGGVITGGYGGTSGLGAYLFGPGTVDNSGSITGNNYQGVAITGNGTVINRAGGSIAANGATIGVWLTGGTGSVVNETGASVTGGRNGVVISGNGSVDNYGTITGLDASYYGVRFSNSNAGTFDTSVRNWGAISGGAAGVSVKFVPGSGTSAAHNIVINEGTITATGAAGTGLSIEGNGAFTNQIINNGTISGSRGILLDQGATGAFANQIINNGTVQGTTNPGLDIRGTASIINNGTIAGKTGILFNNAGTDILTNAGAIIGTGGTAVDLSGGDDTMALYTGSIVTGDIKGGAGTDSLTLDGSGTIGINQITGFEALTKQGSGTWTLTGTGSAGGPVAVTGGTLAVAGNVGDAVNVGTLGTLKGSGSVGSLTDNGLVAPGHSAGTLVVNGDFLLDDPGTLEIEIGGFDPTQSDLLDIAGQADLAGGTIHLLFLDGYDITNDLLPGQSKSLMFLEADEGIVAFASTIDYDFWGMPLGFTYDVFQEGNALWFQATNTNQAGSGAVPVPGSILLVGIGVGLIGSNRRRRTV